MKKSPKQNWESNIRRTPIILGLSAALCMPSAFSYANASDPVAGELVQSVQQGRTVTGKIIDDTGEPLIGVSVLVKGTTVGTITDFDGNYSLEVPSGKHILVISYIGYKTQDITVGKSNQLNIKMEADTQALDEVVVVGYGVMKKRDLTGSIASVKAADIVKSPASNAMEALQGQVPGLDIVRNSGKATSGVTINIRGQRSLSDVKDEFGNNVANAPLFIIDGMQGGDFSDIAPADIESIEVLKDASSTAIYGSQGANGVIIITTKKGAQGKGKTVKVGATTQITHYAQDERAENVLWRAATNAPLGKAYDEDGKVVEYPLGKNGQVSPLVDEASEVAARHHVLKTNLIANGYLDFTPIEGLTFRSNLGTNYAFYRKQDFEGAGSIDRLGQNSTSLSKIKSSEKSFVNWDNIISYNKTVKDHTFGATALTSWTQSKYTSVNAQGEGQLVDSYLWHNLGANDKSSYVIGSDYIQHQTFSYALRFNYSYKGRYMLTVSNRWDGDSRLSKGNKWASFPSVAAAWRISDEAFLKNVEALSNLKLRLSWGKTGNSGIMAYGTQSGLTPKTNSAFQDNGYTYYIYNEYVGNENVGWEMSNTWDLGFDIGLFNNRISAVVDLYQTKTTDILLPRTLPTSMGGSNATPFKMYQNIGATMNRGIEVSVNTVNVDNKNFKWNSTLTFAANHEEITDLIDGKDIIGAESSITSSLLIGRPLRSYHYFINQGIWQENEAEEAAKYFKDAKKTQSFKPGDIKLQDLDGNFIIDDNDRTYLGSQSPKWTGGLNNNFSYKNFDLNVYIIARWGQMIDYELAGAYDPQGKGNFPAYLNYWTPENPSNDFPRPAQTNFYNYLGYESLNYIDGSYWKIKTVSLGYTFPKSLTSKLGVSKLRAYVTANNLFSFAKNHLIQDYDAERGGSAKAPLQRQFIFGLNLDF